jgi:hypothetical protein
MRRPAHIAAALAAAALACLGLAATAAAEEPAAAWAINSLPVPTNFEPGGEASYETRVTNIGAADPDGSPLTIVDTLPAGLVVEAVELPLRSNNAVSDFGPSQCSVESVGETQTVSCTVPATLPGSEPALLIPSESVRMVVYLAVPAAASGQLTNTVEVQGGGAPPATATAENQASPEPAHAGFLEFGAVLSGLDGLAVNQAGSHPYQYTTSFAINTAPGPEGSNAPIVPAEGDIKDVEVKLPPGLAGDPTAVPRCSFQQFNTIPNSLEAHPENECPDASAVGVVLGQQLEGVGGILPAPIYNLVPTKGMPAQLGFQLAGLPFYIDTSLRTGSDYGVSAHLRNTTQLKRVTAASVTIWGVPADERHDPLRGHCLNNGQENKGISLGDCPAGIEPLAFLRLPTSCASPLLTTMSFNRWSAPASFLARSSSAPAPEGCDALVFEPSFEAQPTSHAADSPTGLAAAVHIPQTEDPDELATPDLRETTVVLPPGLVVNPSGANGLTACSPAEIGLTSAPGAVPPTFTEAPAQCPNAAKIGSVKVQTPLLDHPLSGGVYAATPRQNPFGSLLAIYIAVADPETGVVLKLPGRVSPDPATGQITSTFQDTPQQPFEDFQLKFTAGPQAALRTPQTCAPYTSAATLTPWSAPASGPPAALGDEFAIDQGANGAPCAQSLAALPNAPAFDAGTVAPSAGAYSPLVLNLGRADGSQEFSALTLSPPPGLVGKLAGIPYCPDAALAAAAARSGRAELASPSCPASQVGSVDIGAGAGPAPYFTQGRAYLAGPYKGAPLSLAIITPAVAGPYDLGTVVVRTALEVDPTTAQITAVSDPFPRILEGIPLDVRSIAVKLDRPGFTLNPTNCDPLAFTGQETATTGAAANLAMHFQAGGCQGLGFKPELALKLTGGSHRGDHPKLRSVLTMPAGGANIARAAVLLPPGEQIDNAHIQNPCTRVQFAAHQCPKGSILGYAKAFSPLLDEPLQGPVYFRSNGGERLLPDIVADLNGQIHVVLVGAIDAVDARIRTTFATVPDAPVSRFVLNLKGGKQGLLVNNRNICARTYRARVSFDAQNGKTSDRTPVVKTSCEKKKGKGAKG